MTNSLTDLKLLAYINHKQHLPDVTLNLKDTVHLDFSFQPFNFAPSCYPNVSSTPTILKNGCLGSEKFFKGNASLKKTVKSISDSDLNEYKAKTKLKLRMKRNYSRLSEFSEEVRSCVDSPFKRSQENDEPKDNMSDSDTLTANSEDFGNFSDVSSDDYSVDEAMSWKNDQNRGERLLPLKRLKKGYISANYRRSENLKKTDWTDNVATYDNIISVALDHANYARAPTSPANSPNHISPFLSAPTFPEHTLTSPEIISSVSVRVLSPPVNSATLPEPIISSPVNSVTLPEPIISPPVNSATLPEPIISPPVNSATLPEPIIFPPVNSATLPEPIISPPVNSATLPESIISPLPERIFSPPLSIPSLPVRIPTPPSPTLKEPETLPSTTITLPVPTELASTQLKIQRLPFKLNIKFNKEKLVEPKTVVKPPVQNGDESTSGKKMPKTSLEIKPPRSNQLKAKKEGENKSQLHKRRGRPKGSFKHGLTSVRSYRNILRRSRLGRPLRNVVRDIKADLNVKNIRDKRPVGRPRKAILAKEVAKLNETKKLLKAEDTNKIKMKTDETNKASKVEEISKSLKTSIKNIITTEKTPKASVKIIQTTEKAPKLEEKTSNLVVKTVKVVEKPPKAAEKISKLDEISVTQVNSIVEVRVTQVPTISVRSEVVDTNETRSLDENDIRFDSPSSSESIIVVKRPKGRPRLLSILNHIKPQSLLKKKRGRPPKFKPSLLESIRKKESGTDDGTIPVPIKIVEETTPDPLNMSKNQVRNSTLNPSSWLSQLSRRSSLRQVECAFRYREIVVKKQEQFIHILLTSNTRVKNGLNCQVLSELKTALISAKNDEKCHCVMVSGTGGVFCSGIDLISLSIDKTGVTAEKLSSAIRDFCKCLMAFPKPLVAAVNGSAVGLGVSMLPYFDLVYATDKATFYSPYAKLGQVPEGGATYLLPTIMGYARANGLLLEGRKLTATEAYDCGIVTQVLWPATFMEEVIPRVQALANRPLPALESTKALVRYHILSKLEVTLDTECRLLYQHWQSDECRQIIKDFLQNEEVV